MQHFGCFNHSACANVWNGKNMKCISNGKLVILNVLSLVKKTIV